MTWADPVFGLALDYHITDKWVAKGLADVGGGVSKVQWQFLIGPAALRASNVYSSDLEGVNVTRFCEPSEGRSRGVFEHLGAGAIRMSVASGAGRSSIRAMRSYPFLACALATGHLPTRGG